MTPAKISQRVEELSVEDAKTVAQKAFHDKDHAITAIGGIEGLP